MAFGDALAKDTTYGDVEDIVRVRTGTIESSQLSPALFLKLISTAIQKWAKILNGANAPMYSTVKGFNVVGLRNPFRVDLSTVSPFIDTVLRITHITGTAAAGTVSVNATTTLTGVGTAFTTDFAVGDPITVGTSSSQVRIITAIASATSLTVDTAFSGTAGTLTAYKPNTRTLVARMKYEQAENSLSLTTINAGSIFHSWEGDLINLWKGSTFTITIASDAVLALFYRLPIITSVTRASKIDIPDSYTDTIIREVSSAVFAMKNDGRNDPNLDASLLYDRKAILESFGMNQVTNETK